MKICDCIQKRVDKGGIFKNPSDIKGFYTEMQGIILNIIEELVPISKPSPYSKRWWNTNLTDLRKIFIRAKNAARRSRRRGYPDHSMKGAAWEAKGTYF